MSQNQNQRPSWTGDTGEFPDEYTDLDGIPAPPPDAFARFTAPRPRNRGGCLRPALGIGLVVLALVAVALFLPPISLWEVLNGQEDDGVGSGQTPAERLGFTALSAASPILTADGLRLTADPAALDGEFAVRVLVLDPAAYLGGELPADGWHCPPDLPARHALASRVYSLTQTGAPPEQVTLRIAALDGSTEAAGPLTLFGWNADSGAWEFVPVQAGDEPGTLAADLAYMPRCVALFRGAEPARAVGVTLEVGDAFPVALAAANAQIYPAGLRPTATGALAGALAPGFQTGKGYDVLPLVRNYDDPAVIDTATIARILGDPALRAEHARQLAALVLLGTENYAGVLLDYRAVPSEHRDSFTVLVSDLAALLHGGGRSLGVVLPVPQSSADGATWDTGGYDWSALGRLADMVVIAAPLDPAFYAPGGGIEALLDWAAGQVHVEKLRLGLSAANVEDQGGGVLAPVTLDTAYGYLGAVQLDPAGTAETNQPVTAQLVNDAGFRAEFGRDEALQTPYVRFLDAGGAPQCTVWLTDAAALRTRIAFAVAYHLGGVVVWDLTAPGGVPGVADALLAYRLDQPQDFAPYEPALLWTVRDGETIIQQQAGQLNQPFTFQSETEAPALTVEAQFGGIVIGSQPLTVAVPVVELPPPTPTPEQPAPAPPVEQAALPTLDPAILAGADVGKTFEPGAQVFQINANSILPLGRAGFKWVKLDIPYTFGQTPDAFQRTIDEMQANGFKVLFNVVGSAAEIDPANPDAYLTGYADFTGRLALMGADGIEVWRGMNQAGTFGVLDPTLYTRLLALSFNAIKTSDPNTLVISGGLVPGNAAASDAQGWNDDAYWAALAGAGAGQFADCIGVEYIGGAVPPDVATGDPRGDAPIYYLPAVIDRAWNAFGGARPVCLTRFGYLAAEGLPPLPAGYEWAAGLTRAQQAEWLAGAVTAYLGSEKVRLLVVWNIDATAVSESDLSGGYALVRADGTCPACDALTAVLKPR